MIKNIIFDIGKVLVSYNSREFIHEMFPDATTAEHVIAATITGPVWIEIDRGALPYEELIGQCCALEPAYEKEIRHFFREKNVIAQEYPYAVGWIRELQTQGYKVYLLSNYSESGFIPLSKRVEFIKYVDGMIISYRIKTVKPEPGIYEALLQTYQLKAEECVFLDDLPVNLKGAKELGFRTILFQNYEQGHKDLETLLVEENHFTDK